jgi:hypothetical protein
MHSKGAPNAGRHASSAVRLPAARSNKVQSCVHDTDAMWPGLRSSLTALLVWFAQLLSHPVNHLPVFQ